MPTFEETVIRDKIERAHRSRKKNTTKTGQSLRNLTTGSSPSQSKPNSSERNSRHVFRKSTHQH